MNVIVQIMVLGTADTGGMKGELWLIIMETRKEVSSVLFRF